MVLHLLQAPALPDLPGQGGELIVPRLQGQPPLHCGQGPGRVTKVAAQLAQLQPAPHIVRLHRHSLFRVGQGLLQPPAVQQGAGVAVVPHAAAGGLRAPLRRGHPLRRPAVRLIFVQVVAGVGVPEGRLQVGLCRLLGEAPPAHAVLHPLLQVVQHLVKVPCGAVAHGLQVFHILR